MNIEQRLAKIMIEEDVDKQITLAKNYVKSLRSKAKKLPSLAEKIAMNEQIKLAEVTLRQIRRLSFDIDDALRDNKPAISVLAL